MNIICFSIDGLECIIFIAFGCMCCYAIFSHYQVTVISCLLGEKKSKKKIDLTDVSIMHHLRSKRCFVLNY